MISCQRELYSAVKRIGDIAGRSFLVLGAGIAGLLARDILRIRDTRIP